MRQLNVLDARHALFLRGPLEETGVAQFVARHASPVIAVAGSSLPASQRRKPWLLGGVAG